MTPTSARHSVGEKELAAFARKVIAVCCWELGNLDGGDIQELAIKHGLLVETLYDPAIHGPNDVEAEKSDPWFVFAGPLANPPPNREAGR